MRVFRGSLYSVLVALALAGCGSSSNGPVIETPTPPPAQPTNFSTFVQDQFAATSDLTDPVEVDDEDFIFQDEENPTAFDNLLQ